jgi:hypothetical protein
LRNSELNKGIEVKSRRIRMQINQLSHITDRQWLARIL